MPNVFTYGTLEIPEVMEAVTGRTFRSVDATAREFVRFMIKDRIYPGMFPAVGEATDGRLYFDVDEEILEILDLFEDEVYTRELISTQVSEGTHYEAFAYIIPKEHQGVLSTQPWSSEIFVTHHLANYLERIRGFYRRVSE